jgi:hypothetical protein
LENQKQYSEARGYNLGLARELGLPAAVLYNQLIFWDGRSKEEWFYKSYDELLDELPLSKSTLQRSREILEKAEYVETAVRKVNGTPKLHWRISRIATFHMVNLTTSDMVNLTTSINNNKEDNKTQNTDLLAPDSAQQIQDAYRLYLKQFIIPTKLTDEKYSSYAPDRLLIAAENRYKLSPKRRDAIKRRLADAGYKKLAAAIIGYSRSPWHMGDNDRHWIADLEIFICRNYENVERGADLYMQQKQHKNQNDPWADL